MRPLVFSFGIKKVKSVHSIDEAYSEIVYNENKEPYTILISTEDDSLELMQMLGKTHRLYQNSILICNDNSDVLATARERDVEFAHIVKRPYTSNLIKAALGEIQKHSSAQEDKDSFINRNSRILVVDDSETLLHYVKRILNSIGHLKVDMATNVMTAIKMIQNAGEAKESYDLIISDWNMPSLSGLDFLQTVRKSQALQGKIQLINDKRVAA